MIRVLMPALAPVLALSIVWAQAPSAFAQAADPTKEGAVDAKTSDANVRASQLLGMTVYNAEGKELGTVNDLVIHARTGRVRYAALSYGGFLGLGDKLFAVPWQAFECRPVGEGDEHMLVLSVTEETIKSATGFDQDNWPDFGNRKFVRELDAHYGVERRQAERRGGVDVRVGPGGVKVDVDVQGKRDDR